MADVKIHKTEDLKKMSPADRTTLLGETLAALAHKKWRTRTGEDKQTADVSKLRKQAARINTLNNQISSDEK